MFSLLGRSRQNDATARQFIMRHFGALRASDLVTTVRTFPATARIDLQKAVDEVLGPTALRTQQLGLHAAYTHETLTFSHLTQEGHYQVMVGPLQFDEIDVGDIEPAHCLRSCLWLGMQDGAPFAFLMTSHIQYGVHGGVHVEIAVPAGTAGQQLSEDLLRRVEEGTRSAGTYRGKVISLETMDHFQGFVQGIRVHRLEPVTRDEIILPAATLDLLERNVVEFVRLRPRLAAMKMPLKKGLLFYGPPGTGKTYALRLIAGLLPDHTTLLITAEQVGYIAKYLQLARFLQPAIVAIEDVDLIARSRSDMRDICEEALLNKLLNEMDGLRQDAQLMFVLTTNHPDKLEAALASRPGRVDQAIEFPLPDADSRRKLLRLYGGCMEWTGDMVDSVVNQTDKASPAFIKELMRRTSQNMLMRGEPHRVERRDVQAAMEEMLFAGGNLNLNLFGGGPNRGKPRQEPPPAPAGNGSPAC